MTNNIIYRKIVSLVESPCLNEIEYISLLYNQNKSLPDLKYMRTKQLKSYSIKLMIFNLLMLNLCTCVEARKIDEAKHDKVVDKVVPNK
ncbi:MAG: hypothetical protein DRG11_05080 [Epsilonproteobacteria bacterium]|nr:MAG: hypothetical protein DRG11_05080 [Campylobacterota bacterium]